MAGRLSSLWLGTWRCVASSSKLYNVSIRGFERHVSRGGERHLGCEIMYFFIFEACLCIYDSHIYTWKKTFDSRGVSDPCPMYSCGFCLSFAKKRDFYNFFYLFFVFALGFVSPKKEMIYWPPLSNNAWPSYQSFHPSSPPTAYSHSTTHPSPSSTSYPSPSTHPPSSRTQPCYR